MKPKKAVKRKAVFIGIPNEKICDDLYGRSIEFVRFLRKHIPVKNFKSKFKITVEVLESGK